MKKKLQNQGGAQFLAAWGLRLPALWAMLSLLGAVLSGPAAWGQKMPDGTATPDSTAARASICQNGQLQVWGNNAQGQLGLGYTSTFVAQPVYNPYLSNVVATAIGYNHSVALLADGTVRTWGINTYGQLGLGYASTTVTTPQQVPLTCIVAVSANGEYTMALRADGTLWSWGRDDFGQLGYGSASPGGYSATPHQVLIGSPVAQVSCGPQHCLALLTSGTVLGWGANGFNIFGSVYLQYTPTPINLPLGGIGAIARLAGSSGNSALVTASGQVYTWGGNGYGEIGNGTLTNVYNIPVQVSLPAGTQVIDLATTNNSVCAITSIGHLLTWGFNGDGELGDPNCATAGTLTPQATPVPGPPLSNVVAVRALSDAFLATLSNGQVYTWGSGTRGQLGYPVTPNSSGYIYSCTANSPVGICLSVPRRVQTLPPVVIAPVRTDVCIGTQVTLNASGGDGTLYVWTANSNPVPSTGNRLIVAPGVTTTYTVSSGCGAPATITINVAVDCCALNQAAEQGTAVVELDDQYSDFNSSPFNAPAGTVFHAQRDVTLRNDVFQLPNGATILFEQGVSLYLDQKAELVVKDGATLTAACQEMWGGVVVRGEAGGILFSSRRARATLSHSYDGVVLEEASDPNQTPYFVFTDAEFWHNRRSITIHRWDGNATASNAAITGCTFDSDPQYFKSPWQQTAPDDYHYSEAHIIPEGDLRDMPFSNNRFAHCQVGVWMESQLPAWFHLTNSVFEEFQVVGIGGHPHGDNGATAPATTPGGTGNLNSWVLEGNHFRFPREGHQLPQQACDGCFVPHNYYPNTAGVISTYYGLLATSNTFEQLHADSLTAWPSFAQLPHVGIWTVGGYAQLERNRFYQLRAGVWNSNHQNEPVALKQNLFLNCYRGLLLGDDRSLCGGVNATAELSCNSYIRNDGGGRTGNMQGVRAALCGQATLTNPADFGTNYALLKERFDVLNSSPAIVPLVNDGSQTLSYFTFDNYKVDIANACTVAGYYGINISVTGPGSSGLQGNVNSIPGVNTCEIDFPSTNNGTGIQTRPTPPNGLGTPLIQPITALEQSVPNPANDEASIAYQVPPNARQTTLIVREIVAGREVLRQEVDPAKREALVNLRTLPNGVYIYMLVVDNAIVKTRRLLINRQ